MAWNLDSDRPIYAQIVEKIQLQIVSGYYSPGDKLPSVRDLAAAACVNPNTMQKAFSELEKSRLIITQRTSGRVVTEDTGMIQTIQKNLAEEYVTAFIEKMKALGLETKDILCFMEKQVKEDEK